MQEYVIPELHPFDPTGNWQTWIPAAYDLHSWPAFDPAPVGNGLHTAARCVLYRFYDEERRALYFGVTTDPITRWRAHKGPDGWWPLARFVSLQPVPPRERLLWEHGAIQHERPRFNRTRSHDRAALPKLGE